MSITLPRRIELLSLDGPISPLYDMEGFKLPKGFEGKHYLFQRAFYDGSAMDLAIAYKEPADTRKKS